MIVDEDSSIVAHKLETDGINLGRRVIDNVTADFKKIRRDLEKN